MSEADDLDAMLVRFASMIEASLDRHASRMEALFANAPAPAPAKQPAPPRARAPQPARGQAQQGGMPGRAAYCDCECQCWREYKVGHTGCGSSCACLNSRGENCACKPNSGESMFKYNGRWRWQKGKVAPPQAPPDPNAPIEPDDLPF